MTIQAPSHLQILRTGDLGHGFYGSVAVLTLDVGPYVGFMIEMDEAG